MHLVRVRPEGFVFNDMDDVGLSRFNSVCYARASVLVFFCNRHTHTQEVARLFTMLFCAVLEDEHMRAARICLRSARKDSPPSCMAPLLRPRRKSERLWYSYRVLPEHYDTCTTLINAVLTQ